MTKRVKRWAHRAGIAGAAIWWGYAFFSTSAFQGISALGLLVYLVGVPVCCLLPYWSLRGAIGLFWELYSLPSQSDGANLDRRDENQRR